MKGKRVVELVLGINTCLWLGGGERGLMHLVPAPAVKLMKSRVLSRPGVNRVAAGRNLSAGEWSISDQLAAVCLKGGSNRQRQTIG